MAVLCALLDVELSVFTFILLQLLADDGLAVLEVDMLPCQTERLALSQAQKQAAHQRGIVSRILRSGHERDDLSGGERVYILDADRRQLCIFGRVALDSLRLDGLFKRTVQHGQYIFYGFWRFSVINQLAYHLLHLFGGQIAQSDRAQMGLEVIFNDTAIGRDGVRLLRWLNKLGEPGMAVSDMADNWNKFGSSADSVQAAYNGFAKGQFQLLDNLKLGYGGTKEEMERLLDDANKLNAAQGKYTDYSIDSFSDIILAIHDIQTEYDITGTTAKEASTTISGSLSAAKAAWANLVTGVADDNTNFGQLISNFVDSATTAASNIIPRVEVALNGAAKLIESLVPPIMAELPGLIETVLPQLAQSAVNIVQTLVTEISTNAAQLIDSAIQIITVLGNGIYQMLPTVAQSALQIVLTLVSKLNENLPQMLDTAGQMLIAFVEGVSEHLPDIMLAAASIVETLLTYFIEHLPDIVEGAMQMGDAVIDGIIDGISAAWDSLVSWFNGLWDSLFGNRSVNVDVNSSGTTGGRAGGLDYVPYNNYVANLHRGEMVLTADEADSYRRGKGSSNGFTLTQNIYAAKQTPVELAASTAAYFQRARWAL